MNKCLNLRIRTHKGIKYQYCVKHRKKGQINENLCYMCEDVEHKKIKPIKKVSKNKKIVSRETYNFVLERDKCCQMCGTYQNLHLHHIFYRSQRKDLIDDPNNLIMLCEEHHRLVHSNKKKYQPMLLEMMKK